MKILVTGSIAYDVLLSYDGSFADALRGVDLDQLSVSYMSPHFARHHGGTGANIAWNLRLLGQEPLLVGTVGTDGGAYTALLEERGIDTASIERRNDGVTATAIIGTDSGERQIAFFHPGADSLGSWPDLSDIRDDVAYAVIGARDARLMLEACAACSALKIPYLFDPGQQIIALSKDDLARSVRGSRGVIANAYEWQMLSSKMQCSVGEILERSAYLIVTNGEEGLTLHERGKQDILIPACRPEKVVNPTGAGDALRAGLLTGLSAGWSLRDAARLGASIASFVVEQEGTLLDTLDRDEVYARAERTYAEALPELP